MAEKHKYRDRPPLSLNDPSNLTPAAKSSWLANSLLRLKTLSPLLPAQQCRLCQGFCRDDALCQACTLSLADTQSRCIQCALPLKSDSHPPRISCGECLRNPPPFNESITANHYQAPINQWLNNFKVRRDLRDGHLLHQLLQTKLRAHYKYQPWPQLLIPVPLHWSRLLQRGFNQSAWLAQQLHTSLGIEALPALTRHARGRTQKRLNRSQRQKNLRTAFRVKTYAEPILAGKHVALIDDVVTTSATARVISQALLNAGVAKIDIWSLARTDKTDFQH